MAASSSTHKLSISEDIDDIDALPLEPSPKLPSLQLSEHRGQHVQYRLYKKRFIGCAALCFLNAAGGMNWLWFTAISLDVANEFNLTVNQVNWLSNCVNLFYLPVSFCIPWVCRRIGLRKSCLLASISLVLASWIRYAGTSRSLSPGGSYALLFIGQVFAGFTQPWYQVLAPKYSETWFGLQGRTTATMVISLMNPVGSAIAQLLSPVFKPRTSILVLAIISTILAPGALLIEDRPPTPPTYSGSQASPPVLESLRSVLGISRHEDEHLPTAMTRQERIDFMAITYGFGILVAVISAFSIVVAQIYAPYGYNSDQSGFLGAALFIAGIVGAVTTSPLFDRILTHHLAITLKAGIPIIGISWLGLIWAVGSKGLAPSYVVLIAAGFSSFVLLPVALELACEVTRNAELSSAALWFSANLFTVLLVLVANDLRAGPEANPPLNMHKVLIMFAVFALSTLVLVVFLQGKQARREADVRREVENAQARQADLP